MLPYTTLNTTNNILYLSNSKFIFLYLYHYKHLFCIYINTSFVWIERKLRRAHLFHPVGKILEQIIPRLSFISASLGEGLQTTNS